MAQLDELWNKSFEEIGPPDDEVEQEELNLAEMTDWEMFQQIFLTNQLTHTIVEQISNDELFSILDELDEQTTCLLDAVDWLEPAKAFFQLRRETELTHENIENMTRRYMFALAALANILRERNLLSDESLATQDIRKKLVKVTRSIKHGSQNLITELRRQALDEGLSDTQASTFNHFEFNTFDRNKFTPFQRLVVEILDRCFQQELRRYQGLPYEQIKVCHVMDKDYEHFYMKSSDFPNQNPDYSLKATYDTAAWEPSKRHKQLIDLVYACCRKDTNFGPWMDLTMCSPNKLVEYLSECQDPEFPEFKRDRLSRAFYNGCLRFTDNEQPEWYSYLKLCKMPSTLIASKFYPQEFNEELMQYTRFMNIPTPAFQGIFEYQDFSPSVCQQIYAQLGRILYELGSMDRWEVILFFMGVARSGKSTMGRTSLKFFQKEDVGILASSMEATFGLDALVDKLLYVCLEVTKAWNLPRADFQSMISAEEVSVRGKFKVARTVKWSVPGLLFGNELGPWMDSSGSIVRRLLVVEMLRRVNEVDTQLDQKIEGELPALMYKLQQAYLSQIQRCGDHGIWEMVPKYFTLIQTKIAISTNPIKEFLHNCPELVRGDDYKMPLSKFQAQLKAYMNNKKNTSTYSIEQIKDVFQQEGDLTIRMDEVDWNGQHYKGLFVFGLTLRDKVSEVDESKKVADGEAQKKAENAAKKEERQEHEKQLKEQPLSVIIRGLCRGLRKPPATGKPVRYVNKPVTLPLVQRVNQQVEEVDLPPPSRPNSWQAPEEQEAKLQARLESSSSSSRKRKGRAEGGSQPKRKKGKGGKGKKRKTSETSSRPSKRTATASTNPYFIDLAQVHPEDCGLQVGDVRPLEDLENHE